MRSTFSRCTSADVYHVNATGAAFESKSATSDSLAEAEANQPNALSWAMRPIQSAALPLTVAWRIRISARRSEAATPAGQQSKFVLPVAKEV